MAQITASAVKQLREMTAQGMMECKKALTEANGDIQAAVDLLRKWGMVKVEKKAARETKEGLIGIARSGNSASMVEVSTETDFCARNDVFRAMVEQVAQLALQGPDGAVAESQPIHDAVQAAFDKIGENMKFVRGVKMTAPLVGSYKHHNNKVGVLLAIDGEVDTATLNDVCMHIAFADPLAVSPDQVSPELVERERRIAQEQAAESGKPPAIVEKMVTGKVNKFLAENALLEQPFVRDDKKKVKEVLGNAKVLSFARFAIGQAQ